MIRTRGARHGTTAMTEVIPDLEQRQRALSPDHSFIVQAPAGSGKTELLIQRYLRLLTRVEHPEEIVAITFTRKAAAEMRGRIIGALEQVRGGSQSADATTDQTLQTAREVLEQDQKHAWQLESNPGRLRIQTIDSLCAWLTRQMPILAQFGAQPETVEDATELYRQAATEMLADLDHGGSGPTGCAVLLEHLDNNLPKVRDLLADMLARREHWLRHLAGGVDRAALEAALQHSVEATLDRTRCAFPEQYVAEFLEYLRYVGENFPEGNQDSPVPDCRDLQLLPNASVRDLPLWRVIADICLTKSGSWRKRVDNKLFPATGEGMAWKGRLQDLLPQLCNAELQQQLVETRNLPSATYTDDEWQLIGALCELLILSAARLRVVFGERNQIDFSGISLAAISALGAGDNPTDLALQLDYRMRHLLVDEFQDVSINQYRLLQNLTAGWSQDDGHTLFLVGDPMQSIYRFREAEVGLFMVTWEQRRLGQVPLTPLQIAVNFRSQAGLVDWVNAAFRRILPEQPDSLRGAVNFTAARAFHPRLQGEAVQVHPILGDGIHGEAEKIVELVVASGSDAPGSSTAILVRSRTHLAEIIPRLKAEGLRFRAVEIEELGKRPAVRDLLALTGALYHYADRIAWLAILRAPWCGLTLADLHVLVHEARERTVWECMQDDSRLQRLSPDGLRRLTMVREVMKLYFMQQRRRSLRRSVESVWMSLGGPATLEDETDLENTRAYFELLEQFDDGGELSDRERFISRVESLFASADIHADASLQIMTMHKAKGLEFDTVILPGLGRGTRQNEAQLLLWTEAPHGLQQELLLAPIKETGADTSPIYAYMQGLERQKQYFEAGRLLYVAATRARRRLHLLGRLYVKEDLDERRLSRPRDRSLLGQLWPVIQEHFEQALVQYQGAAATAALEPTPGLRLRRLHPDWVMPAAPEFFPWHGIEGIVDDPMPAIEYEWAGLTIRHVGTVVHRYLHAIAEEGMDNWGVDRIRSQSRNIRQSLRQLGVPQVELDSACRRVEQALLHFTGDDRGRWLLADHELQQNEYGVSGVLQGRVVNIIVDRTFVDQDGVRWIVDYKTSSHEGTDIEGFLDLQQGRYRQQLEKYGTLFQNMEDRPIRLGLYFPLLQGWREWEYE